ncbi:MAG TPA: hypothetical protein QGH10_07420 [Armatimonadota bacterium]|nr:hypothetical protein [Armatimonadota bacterium]
MRIALLMAGLTASVSAQELRPVAIERTVPISIAVDEEWSWHGLPLGPVEAAGVSFEIGEAAVTAEAVEIDAAPVVYAVVTPVVEGHLMSVEFERADGETQNVGTTECALAWAADEPRMRRVLLARGEGGVTRVEPNGCYLLALVVGDDAAARDEALKTAYATGQREWEKRFLAEAPPVFRLQEIVDGIPKGKIAVIPPTSSKPGALTMVLQRTGLDRKMVELTQQDLIDPEAFNAERFPVAFQFGHESYIRSVREPSDAADAVVRYIEAGGTLIVTQIGPYPFYYATDAGKPKPQANQPLLARVGVGIAGGFEKPPEGATLMLHPMEGQGVLRGVQEPWPWPTTGDQRLRVLDAVGEGATATRLVELRDEAGTLTLPVAVLFECQPKGAVLYVASPIVNDAAVSQTVMCDIVAWMAGRVGDGTKAGSR